MRRRKIKVGIVGLGGNGVAHIRAHMQSDISEVVAVCDRSQDRLHAAGQQFGIPGLYTDEKFYADPQIEAIGIHTGDNDHKLPFLKAVAAGKHVLVEKPLANSEQDVREMVEAAAAAGPKLKIQVGYILRFNPVCEAIREMVRSGQLGEIYYMEADYIHNLLFQANCHDPVTGQNWYLKHEIPIVGGGSHPLDILRWISGKEVIRVVGYSNHVAFAEMSHDDCQVGLFRFEDGTVAKVAALYAPRCAMAPYYNVRIYGTNGTIERDTAALSASQEDLHPAFKPIDATRPEGHPYLPEIVDWLEAILEQRNTRTPLYDGANSTMATLCAARAIREGTQVDVPLFTDGAVSNRKG